MLSKICRVGLVILTLGCLAWSASAATTFTATTSGNWNSGATWGNSGNDVEGSGFPGAGDTANVPGTISVTVAAGVTNKCAVLVVNSGTPVHTTNSVGLAASTSRLEVSGNVTIQAPASGSVNSDLTATFRVGAGTMTVGGILTINSQNNGGNAHINQVTVGTGTLNVAGNIVMSGGGSAKSAVTITSGLFQFGGASITLGGGSTFTPGTGTAEYYASGAQALAAGTYGTLRLLGSGAKTGTVTVNTALERSGTATYSGTVTYGNNANLFYTGSAAQTSGPELLATVPNLTITNANGVTVTNALVTVTNVLTLTSGNIFFSQVTNVLALNTNSTVSRTSGHVVGLLRKGIGTNAVSSTLFEVGLTNDYSPVKLSLTNVTQSAAITVGVVTNDQPNLGTSTLDTNRSANIYWVITNATGLAFTSGAAGFEFTSGVLDAGAVVSQFKVGQFDGSTWAYPETEIVDGTHVNAHGLTSFKQFALAAPATTVSVTDLTLSTNSVPYKMTQAVTFTATVITNGGSGIPVGGVEFQLDGVPLITNAVDGSGIATYSYDASALGLGDHTITATYQGDTDHTSSFDTATLTVVPADTTTVLTSSTNLTVTGQLILLKATVSVVTPGGGIPGGVVSFYEGTNWLGSGPMDSNGEVTAGLSKAVGSYTFTAVYEGTNVYNGSTSAGLGHTVVAADTSVSIASSKNPAVFGESVTFVVTVDPVAPSPSTPYGDIVLKTNGVSVGTLTLVNGKATNTLSSLPVGTHAITAEYQGNINYNASTNSLAGGQVVNKADTINNITATPNPSVFGQSVTNIITIAAVAPGVGTPTGNVIIKTNGTTFTTLSLVNGLATNIISSLPAGTHAITAEYGGDSSFNVSTNSVAGGQVVNQAGTTLSIDSSSNPSVFGQSVTNVVTVTTVSPGVGTPGGSVIIKTNGAAFATLTLIGGKATNAIASLPVGTHTITAEYTNTVSFIGSTNSVAGGQVVNQAGTTLSIGSTPNPSVFGQSVTNIVTVSTVSPGAGTPGGSVIIKTNGSTFATLSLVGGAVTNVISSLPVGTHTITAEYASTTSFVGSTNSVGGGQVVNQASTTLSIGATPNPSVFGQSVTNIVTITTVAPGVGTPGGSVVIKTNGTTFATLTLVGGKATNVVGTFPVGTHTVTAEYASTTSFVGSTNSVGGGQVVNKDGTSTAINQTASATVTGEGFTINVTVTASAPGSGTPSGTVTLFDSASNVGSTVLNGSGQASFSLSSTSGTGQHSYTVQYSGTNSFNSSTSTAMLHTNNAANTTTAVTTSQNPSFLGEAVNLVATISVTSPGVGAPTGTVQFTTNSVNFGAPVTLVNGSATNAAVTSLPLGTTVIGANYSGDSSFNSSSGNLSQTVLSELLLKISTVGTNKLVEFYAHTNVAYHVEGAASLNPVISWQNLGAPSNAGGFLLQYLDTSSSSFTNRFYRVLSP